MVGGATARFWIVPVTCEMKTCLDIVTEVSDTVDGGGE